MSSQDLYPFVVGIGGTVRGGSSTEQALVAALSAAETLGARTRLFGGAHLAALPHYLSDASKVSPEGQELVSALRRADGVIVASPGYHGSISGLVKNALDYSEALARDARVYLDGVPMGFIVTSHGWQATGSTLATLRAIAHALRAWPTPLGVSINSSVTTFDEGRCNDPRITDQLGILAAQVLASARNARGSASHE